MLDILIVDDEKIERNGIRFLLKQLNIEMQIREAVNGAKALEALDEKIADILLTDIKMPFMDGLELAEQVVERFPQMKMVIFSGYGEFEYARQAMKSGVSSYILKPVNPEEFKSMMEKVIRELETERLEKELREKSRNFVKEHILLSLLNGMEPDEVRRGVDDLGDMEFIKEYQSMMLIEFDRDFFGKKDTDFSETMQKAVEVPFHYLNMNQQQCVLFFGQKQADRHKAADIQAAILNAYEEPCYVAVSGTIEHTGELAKEYEKLELLMENKFYLLEDTIFMETEETEETSLSQIDDDTLMKQVRQDIKMKDMVGLRQHFERLCEKYQSKKNFSQMYVKFIFSNLLKDVYEMLGEEKKKELNQEIDRLYRTSDFNEVAEILNRGILLLESSFSFNPQMMHREIETVKQYIYANYDKELSVDMLADQVYMAPSYLSHIFKKETGQNLSKFIKALRMEKAKEMLEQSHNKIVNISYAVGYPNVSYFCQSFREYFGVSPQKYRDQGEGYEKNNAEVSKL